MTKASAHNPYVSTWWQWVAIVALALGITLPRILHLGSFLTIDEQLWIDRGQSFVGAFAIGDFAHTVPSIQPGVTTAWLTGMAARFGTVAAAQASIALATTVLLFSALYFISRLWPRYWTYVAGVFLALDPFLLAHSRVAHTDALLALTLLNASLCVFIFVWYGKQQQYFQRYLVYSGIFLGLATLTKIFALALFPIIAGFFIYQLLRQRRTWRQFFSYGVWVVFAFAATVFLLWPALWVQPLSTITSIYQAVQPYADNARSEEVTSMWWYYPREIGFRTTVPEMILFIPALIAFFRTRKHQDALSWSLSWLLVFGVLYALILSLKGERSDRYVLFTMLAITLTAAAGLREVTTWIKHEWKRADTYALPILLACIIGYGAWNLYKLEPYYLAHYNRLYPVSDTHKLGWGEGLEQAAAWFSKNHPDAPIATYYMPAFRRYYTGMGSVETISHPPDTSGFVVIYRAMFGRGPDAIETDYLNNYLYSNQKPVYTVTINGLPYVWVFHSLGND